MYIFDKCEKKKTCIFQKGHSYRLGSCILCVKPDISWKEFKILQPTDDVLFLKI